MNGKEPWVKIRCQKIKILVSVFVFVFVWLGSFVGVCMYVPVMCVEERERGKARMMEECEG